MTALNTFIISRTDNLGDVMLTLPLLGVLKMHFPNSKIYFLGKAYTKPILDHCAHVDGFIDRADLTAGFVSLESFHADVIVFVFPDKEVAKLALKAKISLRIGTSHRWFHWIYANQLVHVGRKKSDLHEAQLNIKLVSKIIGKEQFSLPELANLAGFSVNSTNTKGINRPIIKNRKLKIILHPKSKGSAREWNMTQYHQIVKCFDANTSDFYITGTKAEGDKIKDELSAIFELPNVTDLTGKLSLEDLIHAISQVDILVACSTGPLHIAAALGIHALGIYPPMRPLHPGRWAPLGKKATVFCINKACSACEISQKCTCMNEITYLQIYDYIQKNIAAKDRLMV